MRRGALALLLMGGFYLLALVVAVGLIAVPWLERRYGHTISPYLFFLCTGAGLVIIVSIVPRRRKFVAPGPAVTRTTAPGLFSELDRIAGSTGVPVPAAVYVVLDANAGVARVGGVLGIGAREILVVGLPLMSVLTVSELRSILAHEFGHYHGGETKIGPIIYRTREAIGRTVFELGAWGFSLVRKPFALYGRAFLRITQAVSRQQEYEADRMAADVAGPRSVQSALRKTHSAALGLAPFLNDEVGPAVHAGFLPPVAEGFERFLRTPTVAVALEKVHREAEAAPPDPYDSHPKLLERLAALEQLPFEEEAFDPRPAITLLGDLDELEQELVVAAVPTERPLQEVSWEDVGQRVWPVLWREECAQAEVEALGAIKAGSLASIRANLGPVALSLVHESNPRRRHARTANVLAAALGLALLGRGWAIRADLGEAIELSLDGQVIRPSSSIVSLVKGTMVPEEWEEMCRAGAIEEMSLGEGIPVPT